MACLTWHLVMRFTGLLSQSYKTVMQGIGDGEGGELEMKILLFIPPHSTNDLSQCEINFDNVYFTYE